MISNVEKSATSSNCKAGGQEIQSQIPYFPVRRLPLFGRALPFGFFFDRPDDDNSPVSSSGLVDADAIGRLPRFGCTGCRGDRV
jgi:hypothetical protein